MQSLGYQYIGEPCFTTTSSTVNRERDSLSPPNCNDQIKSTTTGQQQAAADQVQNQPQAATGNRNRNPGSKEQQQQQV